MSYDIALVGIIGTILGALIGAWISSRLTFGFQQRLLQQQLDFHELQNEREAAFRKQMHDEQIAVFKEFRNMINTRMAHSSSRSL